MEFVSPPRSSPSNPAGWVDQPGQSGQAGHPLDAAFAAVSGAVPVPAMVLGEPPSHAGAGTWVSLDDLLAGCGAELDRLLAATGAENATTSRTVIAKFFIDGYAWYLAGAAIAGYVGGRRVPHLSAGSVRVLLDRHAHIDGAGLAGGRFACLPGDPAAAHPDAVVVPGLPDLQAYLRREVVSHLTPLVAALRARSSLGERAFWLGVADHCVRLYLAAVKHADPAGCLAVCEAEAEALIGGADSPLRGPTGVMFVVHADRREPWIKRAACCLGYHIPAHGRCDHCPIYPVPDRIERVGRSLAAQASA